MYRYWIHDTSLILLKNVIGPFLLVPVRGCERVRDEYSVCGWPADRLLLHRRHDLHGQGGPHCGQAATSLQHTLRSVALRISIRSDSYDTHESGFWIRPSDMKIY